MSLKERIYGLETEYAINFYVNEGSSSPNPTYIVQVLQECLLKDCGIASSNFLVTGGKFHHDVGHAEWSLPECRSVRELVAYDKAADHLLRHAVIQAEQKLENQGYNGHLLIAKNNVDSAGNTYGTHENYLMLRDTDLLTGNYFRDYLMHCLIPFLVTRQILAGSGHVLISPIDGRPTIEISQRSHFINTVINANTSHYRPLINLGREDQPLATGNFRRFHLILGDANLSGWATWMKVASMSIILRMIEDIFISDFPAFNDPIGALHSIAGDPTCRIPLPMRNGKYMTAVDVQWQYLELANIYLDKYGSSDEERLVIDAWERALTDLRQDPMRLRDRSDWVSKKYLMDAYLQQQGLSFEDISGKDESVITHLQSIDLLYHDISAGGLFSSLWPEDTLLSIQEIRRAQIEPPCYTRARIRGALGLLQEQYQIPVVIDDWINASISNVIIELPDPLEFDHPRLYAIGEDPLKLLEQAVKRSPERADLHYRLGCFYLRLLCLKKSVQAFDEAIRIDADQANFHAALARALVLQGAYEKAISNYQTAHQLTEERSELHFSGMGEAFRYLGRYEQALRAYSLQLKITPDDLSTHENIGQVYLKTGQVDAAEKTFLFVHEQDPERPVSALALGMIRFSRGAKKISVQAPLQRVLAPLSRKQAAETTPSALRYLQAFASIGMGNKEGLSLLQKAFRHRTPLAAQGIFLAVPLIDLLNHAPKPPRMMQQIQVLARSTETILENSDEDEEQIEMAALEDSLWWKEAIHHSNELIRARAAQYALWRKEGEAIPLLKNLLTNDASDHVRCTAAKALATLGNEEVGSILYACLHDPDCSIPVKWAAEEGLERIRRGKAKPPYPWEMAETNEEQEQEEYQFISIPPVPTFSSIRIVNPVGFSPVPLVCSSCGATNPVGETFCSNCGARIERTMDFNVQRTPTNPRVAPTGGGGAIVQPPPPASQDPWSGAPAASGWGVPAQQRQPAWGLPSQPQASGSVVPRPTRIRRRPAQLPTAWGTQEQSDDSSALRPAPVQSWGTPFQQSSDPYQVPPPPPPEDASLSAENIIDEDEIPEWLARIGLRDDSAPAHVAPLPPAPPRPSSSAAQSGRLGSPTRDSSHDDDNDDIPLIEIIQ